MSKIFEGLDKAASRQIQNIVRQNPKGSADEKMLLQRYIKTPIVQDFNLSPEEWIGQATKWLASNQNDIKKNYPDVDTSDLIDLATKMYEDFLAMQGQLEEARWKGKVIGGITGGPLGALAADQIEKYMNDPEYAAQVNKKFSDLVNAAKGKAPDTAAPTASQAAEKPAAIPTKDKPRARVNPETGALEPVKTTQPASTKTTKPKATKPKATKKPTPSVEPPQTLGQQIGKKGYEPDVRTWRNVGDKASDVAKVASKTPIGRKLAGLGAAAGIVGGIGSQMYAGIEDKFKELIGKDADKPKPAQAEIPPNKPAASAPNKVETPPPPPQSSQPAVEPESDILGAPGADTAERTTPLDGPTGGTPPIGTSSEPDILGAPGADVSEPNSPIDRDRSRDRSTDAVIPQRPKKIEYDQPEMPFENTDAVAVPQPTGGAVKKVAKTVGKGILPAATALTVGDDYKDLQKRLGSKDYTGAALRGVATTTGLIPHLGAQAVSAGAEGLLAMKDNPEYFKNYKPTSSIGRGIKEGYSAGAVGGTGLGEGDKPPKAGFNKNPHKVGPGTSKDDYEYKNFIPRDRKEKGEEWAIARDIKNVNSRLGKKKPKELNTGFYKNYLGNRPIREEEIDEAGGRLGAINTVAQLFKSIAKGGDPVDMDIQQRQMNALMRKYNIDYKDIGIKKPAAQTPKQTASPDMKPGQYKTWDQTLPSFDDVPAAGQYKTWMPDPLEEVSNFLALKQRDNEFKKIFGTTPLYKEGDKIITKFSDTTPNFKGTVVNFDEKTRKTTIKGEDGTLYFVHAQNLQKVKETINTPGGMGQAYRKLKLKPDEMDEGIAGAVKSGTKRIATMRKYFAGDETAKDPTDTSIQRAWFADPKNQSQLQPKTNQQPQPVKEYDANLISQIAAANQIKNPDLIYPGQKITLPSGDSYTVQKGDTLGDIVYNRNRPAVQEPVIAQPKIEVPKEVPVIEPKAEPRISNRYPDSGVSSDSKFVDVRNNPGNLRGTDALRKPGYVLDKAVGFDKNGFAIFNSPEDGKEAMRRQLELDALKRGMTGRQLINKYAPPSDNNDTDAYIKNTFGELGLDPDSKISPEDLEKIQRLMVRQEHGKEGMNFYYPQRRQMVAKVNEMEILQKFLDKNIEKGAEKLAQKEKEKAAKERPIPNPNAEYQGPKSAAYDISLRKQSVDPVDVAMAALPKDIEDAKKLKQQAGQAPKESSILKGIKGHKF
jgi:hypothetical protein